MDRYEQEVRPVIPAWYWIVAGLTTLWGAIGCYICYRYITLGADAMGPASGYDRALHASMPDWYDWVFTVAVGTNLLGGVALLARSRWAQALFLLSLIAVLVQFGWFFATTDVIAAKGIAEAAGFPIFIIAVALFQVWFSGAANARGWLR